MKVSIQIVTYGRDFRYLVYCLRSVLKFTQGFHECVISCPDRDQAMLEAMLRDLGPGYIRLKPRYFREWDKKGMLHHMYVKLHADACCPEAEHILHMDSDHVLTQPVTPFDYFTGCNPDFVYASFDWLCEKQDNLRHWQANNKQALGVVDEFEFMRRPPIIHCREAYAETRTAIEKHTGRALDAYLRDQRNEFPQTFAEFQALGSVAFRNLHDRYNWVRQETAPIETREPLPEGVPNLLWKAGNIYQAWSHRPPTAEDMAKYKELGIL